MTKLAKKRHPIDATLRNVRASKKRDVVQDAKIEQLFVRLRALEELMGVTYTQDAPSEPTRSVKRR